MKRSFSVLWVHFSYAGNGGFASITPQIRRWWGDMTIALDGLIRAGCVDRWAELELTDTPITHTRCVAAKAAVDGKFDFVGMVDSDMWPDMHALEPGAKPFFSSSFKYMCDHYDRGPVVIGAPYCGPPPHENVYVFQWGNLESDNANPQFSLDQFSREHAAAMTGITPVGALPTGLILFDVRLFEMLDPPWFDYEYEDKYHTKKVSTEDVVTTRDMSMIGRRKLGYNPVLCNWDAWAGHWKPKCVGKPRLIDEKSVGDRFARAVLGGHSNSRKLTYVDVGKSQPTAATPAAAPAPSPQPSPAGRATRLIDGHSVITLDHETPMRDLQALQDLVRHATHRFGEKLSIVELGSWVGESAVAMRCAAPEASITCVDHFLGNPNDRLGAVVTQRGAKAVLETFLENTRDSNVTLIAGNTVSSASRPEAPDVVHLLFIDAGHEYEDVHSDIGAWLPKLHDHGILCGHDYGAIGFPGVKRAVDERAGNWVQVMPGTTVWYVNFADFFAADCRPPEHRGQSCPPPKEEEPPPSDTPRSQPSLSEPQEKPPETNGQVSSATQTATRTSRRSRNSASSSSRNGAARAASSQTSSRKRNKPKSGR